MTVDIYCLLKKIFLLNFIEKLFFSVLAVIIDTITSIPLKEGVFLFLMLNIFIGVCKAIVLKQLSSKKFFNGIISMLMQLFIVFISSLLVFLMSKLHIDIIWFFDDFVVVSIILYNFLSIIENLIIINDKLGLELRFLTAIFNYFKRYNDLIEKTCYDRMETKDKI